MRKKIFRTLGRKSILFIWLAATALAQPTELDTALSPNYLAPTSYLIEDIRVTGTKTLAPEALLSMVMLKAGDKVQIPGATIADTIKKLWQQKLIQDIAIYASKVVDNRIVLTIDITESPRLSAYNFEGISKQEQKELTKKTSLAKGKIVTDWLINNIQKILQKHLVSQGYLAAVVHITSLPDPNLPGYKQVTIQIDKKHKSIINSILFEGNHNIDHKILKLQMQHMQEKPRFTLVKDILSKLLTAQTWKSLGAQALRKESLLKQLPTLEEAIAYLQHHVIPLPSALVQAEYTEDKKRLIHYYQTKGYQDATIVEETVCKNKEGLIDIKLRLEEGQQYFISNITWVGNYIHAKDTLNQILDIHPGDVYNPALIQRKLDPAGHDVASLYMDNGHLFFKAEPIARIVGNAVDLVIRVQEGPQVYINRVDIRGNTYTHDHVIRRELRTLPGDKFSRAQLLRSQHKLVMLNIFAPSKLKIITTPDPPNATVDLMYEVAESSNFILLGGIGPEETPAIDPKFGTNNFSLRFGTNNFSLRNALRGKLPIGEAQDMSINLTSSINLKILNFGSKNPAKNHGSLFIRFDDPWLGLGLAIDKTIWYDNKISSLGGRITFRKMLRWLDNYMGVRGSLHFRHYYYEDFELLDDKTKHTGVLKDIGPHISLERNSIDNPIYPTEGSELGLYIKLTPPYSLFSRQDHDALSISEKYTWAEYHQWMIKSSYFKRLFGDWVLNIQFHAGIAGRYTQPGASPFGRFVMGGTHLMGPSLLSRESIPLRGYPGEHILPKDAQHGLKGGTIFDKIVLELRHPLGKSIGAYGVIFAEAGNTGLECKDLLPRALKKSVGVGIRLATPFGILGLDCGYGLDKEAQKGKIETHFLVGSSIH